MWTLHAQAIFIIETSVTCIAAHAGSTQLVGASKFYIAMMEKNDNE